MNRLAFVIVLLCAGAAACTPVRAAGWVAALKNTPAESFDDEDLRLFLAAAGQVLDAPAESAESAWSNPRSGAAGRFLEVGRSQDAQGQDCRRVRFWVSARSDIEQSAVWTACRGPNGRWQLTAAH